MPFPHEWAARQHDPSKYDQFRRVNDAFGKGIHAIYGRRKTDKKWELQTIRFNKEKFTPEQAKEWLKKHDYKTNIE